MKKKQKYDPDDIESILLHKSFTELAEEEKEFVLHHVDSPEEYESMRKTLQEILQQAPDEGLPEPPSSIKTNLMAEFAREKKGGFAIWLNSVFALPSTPWYKQRGFGYSLAVAGVSAGIVFLLMLPGSPENIAELHTNEVKDEQVSKPLASEDVTNEIVIPETAVSTADKPEAELRSADGTLIEMPKPVSVEEITEDLAEESYDQEKDQFKTIPSTAAVDDEAIQTAPQAEYSSEPTEVESLDDFMDVDVTSGNMASPKTLESVEITSKSAKSKVFADDKKATMSVKAANKKDLLDLLYTAL